MTVAFAVIAAVFSSICAALSNVLQHRSAQRNTPGKGARLGLLWSLAHKPVWLVGFAAAGAALVLHAIALQGAQLALVQPILVSSLLFALPASALLEHRRPNVSEWAWAALLTAALATFLGIAQPSGGVSHAPGRVLLLALAGAGAIEAMAVITGTRLSTRHRASFLGLATGVAYGMVAPLIKQVLAIAGADPLRLVTTWPAYGLVLIGASAILLNQTAYQAGPLAATLPPLTMADPIIATSIGVIAFGDRLQAAPLDVVGELLAAAAIALAVWSLTRKSPARPSQPTPPATTKRTEYRT